MEREPINFLDLRTRSFYLWDRQWFLLTSGDFAKGHFNTMTVSWGSLGIMWDRPFAQVVVRPVRYTREFLERYDTFTLSVLPKTFRKALNLLGQKSGRDGDKIAEAGLTPIAARKVAAPTFAEAELVLECRKMYWQDYDPTHFLDSAIHQNYPEQDYHRVYFGEILAIEGTRHYTTSIR